MALSTRLELRQTTSLVMTPQLQQAIKLLQLSNFELASYVEQELERNPLLERADSDDQDVPSADAAAGGADGSETAAEGGAEPSAEAPSAGDGEGGDAPLDVEYDDPDPGERATDATIRDAGDLGSWSGASGRRGVGDGNIGYEQTLSRDRNLRELLHDQLGIELGDPIDRMIGVHLIDSLDETGYLTTDLESVAALLGCEVVRVEATLERMQRFDPPGIFARNLSECLSLQLRERNRLDPAMESLLTHLDILARRDVDALRKLCGVDGEDLSEMVAEIRALDPKPGLAFDTPVIQAVIPDVIMRAEPTGGWVVELNTDTLPKVLVNERYYARVSREVRKKDEKAYISEQFQSANWLVKSLHQRANTILRVATEIVRQQDGFFAHGVQHLRPLVLRDIAAAIDMHESTVSRVTTNKYMATPRGVYELKYFFTSAIASSSGGASHSAEAVRFRIKALIEEEPVDHILADDKIVEILREEGIEIARRTVAKYREAMRIPSSVQRRRDKTMVV